MRRASFEDWYRGGRGLSNLATYAYIADELGLDGASIAAAAASPEAVAAGREEFDLDAALGVHQYPTLLLTFAGTTRRVGGPVTKPDDLIRLYEAGVASAAA
jgi:protein-disulfide isomerase-like protein with CxxC motif